jgi:hypothetical protein
MRLHLGRLRRVWLYFDLGGLWRCPDQCALHTQQLLPPGVELPGADRVLARHLARRQVTT